jgi:hypothetical protein
VAHWVPSPESFARYEAIVRADNNGELPPAWHAIQEQNEIMRQPLPHQIRIGMTAEEMEAARMGNMRANLHYLAGSYFFHPSQPNNQPTQEVATIWLESEGGDDRLLPHLYGSAESIFHFGFMCRCDNPESHRDGAIGQEQRSWIKHCHEKLDHAGKDCITYLESLEIDRQIFQKDNPGTYERMKPYEDIIESLRTGRSWNSVRRRRAREGRRGGFGGFGG